MKHYFLVPLVLVLSSCIPFGFNMCGKFMESNSPCAHGIWVENMKKEIGKTIYSNYMEYRKNSKMFLGSKTLSNGHIENAYSYRAETCHYFYEYEPKSGIIVNFRFEELKGKYSCRATGA